jgi:hypothetical protein
MGDATAASLLHHVIHHWTSLRVAYFMYWCHTHGAIKLTYIGLVNKCIYYLGIVYMALFSGKKAECFRVFFVKDLIMSGIHKTSINYFHGVVVFTKLNLMF